MNVLLLFPRLDTSFKNLGPVPARRGPIPPIRRPWVDFCSQLIEAHQARGDSVDVVERPLWQFTKDFVSKLLYYDRIYMPHKQKVDFDLGTNNIYYYAQTVLPHYFTVDPQGWGANLSYCPLEVKIERCIFEKGYQEAIEDFYTRLCGRAASNISKFDQPSRRFPKEHYDILFVCQIPHDETIKYHSDVGVFHTLVTVLEGAKLQGYSVLVKGHPVNPSSMQELRNVTLQYPNATWIDDISIHDALTMCDAVAMVNSGVGIEAMLYDKEIFTFGRSEYQKVVNYGTLPDKNVRHSLTDYKMFLYDFFEEKALDTTDQAQFRRNLP